MKSKLNLIADRMNARFQEQINDLLATGNDMKLARDEFGKEASFKLWCEEEAHFPYSTAKRLMNITDQMTPELTDQFFQWAKGRDSSHPNAPLFKELFHLNESL